MNKFDASKFVFHETFTNSDGKQSGSGFAGVVLSLIAGCMAIAGTVGFFLGIQNVIEYLDVMIKLVAASTILLGVRKVAGNFAPKNTTDVSTGIIDEEKG